MKTTLALLIALVLTACQTALPVKVPGLMAAQMKRNNCLQCALLVEKTVKKTGRNAQWVSLWPTDYTPRYCHAICVLEDKGKTYAYDSQYGSMIDLRLKPAEVFNAKGVFIADTDLIHRRARPFDFFNPTPFDELGLGIGVRLPYSSYETW